MNLTLKTLFGCLILAASVAAPLAARGGVMIAAPAVVEQGDTFDVTVSFDLDPVLAATEAVAAFDFDVVGLSGISFLSAVIDGAFDDVSTGNTVGGTSLFGVAANSLGLATLSFVADAVGGAGGSVLGPSVDSRGVLVQDGLTFDFYFQDIDGSFALEVEPAGEVPVPGSLLLLVGGLIGLARVRPRS